MNQTPEMMPSGDPMPVWTQMPPKKRTHPVYNIIGAIVFPCLLLVTQTVVGILSQFIIMFNGIGMGLTDKALEEYTITTYSKYSSEMMIVADLIIIGVLLLWFGCRRQNIPKALEMKKVEFSRIPMAFVAGIGMSFALSYLMSLIESFIPQQMEEYSEHMSIEGSNLSYILAGVVLAPIIEELLFRALSVKYLDRVLPRALSIFLVGGFFGLVHGNLIQALYAGILGVLLCSLFFAYDSIWVSIALHFGFNIVSILALFDFSTLSEGQQMLLGLGLMLFEFLAIFGGGVALVFLFIQRTHPIFSKQWKKPRGKEKARVDFMQ